MFHQGEWGTVCDSLWDLNDAQVVCRHLGYGVALAAPGRAAFGRGAGKVWLNWVQCKGGEDFILDCPHTKWGQSQCGHSEDASVICSAPSEKNDDFWHSNLYSGSLCVIDLSTGGPVDKRSPQSHLCDPGSIPVLAVSSGLSLLLVLTRGFFSGVSGFPPSTKGNTSNSSSM